jgi:hypothetical protein
VDGVVDVGGDRDILVIGDLVALIGREGAGDEDAAMRILR